MIDDDAVPMRYYVTALKLEGYEVRLFTGASEAKKALLEGQRVKTNMFILDVMMDPTAAYQPTECENGLLTGLLLALDLRKQYSDIPIVLFSNANLKSVANQSRRLSSRLSRCAFLRKVDYPPDGLVHFVNDYFKNGRFTSGILKRFLDSLILKPNFQGVGIDLKRLGDGGDE